MMAGLLLVMIEACSSIGNGTHNSVVIRPTLIRFQRNEFTNHEVLESVEFVRLL